MSIMLPDGMYLRMEPVGSRITRDPVPPDADEDFLYGEDTLKD